MGFYEIVPALLRSIGQSLDKNIFPKTLIPSIIESTSKDRYGLLGLSQAGFTDYLNARSRGVVLDATASQWSPATSGILQGSILGRLNLFSLQMIRQAFYQIVRNLVSTRMTLNQICSMSSAADCERAQQALTHLTLWSQCNNIHFNTTKRKVMSITRKKTPVLGHY